jgi:lipopolysaccharide export system protein LptA
MRKLNYIFLGILILLVSVSSQQSNSPREIRLKYADSLVGSNTPGIAYRDFYGNVQLEHGDVNVRSDFAKQYLDANKSDLIGNVIITQKTLTLKSPKIFYDGNTSVARAFDGVTIKDKETFLKADGGTYNTKTLVAEFNGNVFIEDDSAKIFSDFIVHNRNNRKSFAYGNVLILGKFTNAILKSDTLINIPNENYSFATGKPALYQIDSTYTKSDTLHFPNDSIGIYRGKLIYDTLSVTCDTMHAYRQLFNEKYVFIGNVEIIRGGVTARAKNATFFKDDDMIVLQGNPVVWYDSTQLYADSIIIRMPNKELKAIEAYNNSIAVSRNDTISLKRLDQLMGNRIIIDIDSGKVEGITSIGDAKSLYFFRDEEGESGVDRRTTDSIKVEFINGEIENIIWLGMTYAEFFPETFVYGKEDSYYLPLFQWLDNKPKRTKLELPDKVYKLKKN